MTKLTILCAGALMLVPGVATAQSHTLNLIVGGEAYDGPPKFEVSFNGQVLGEGVVDSAIDTASAGRFADAVVKSAYLQTFSFTIPDDAFAADGEVRLRFLNEAYGGDGSNRDRNLYLASVSVNGREVPAVELRTMAGTALEPNAILGEYLVIFDGTADAVAVAPDEGWPMPEGVEVAETPAAPEPAVKPDVAPAAEEVAEAPKLPAAEDTPAAAAAESADVAVVTGPATAAPTATAVETVGVEGCALDQLYNVLGFNENSNELTARVQERLDQVLADIGTEECVVSVIGYSSTVGDYATNALFAVERAQNVLAYMREHGLKVAKATATGAGETEQFGADPAANRRVVITVSP
jgi:outer membrane protein OmpA-like peptidoglycan-associated protein